jgi:general bacterial porin, GBP family
MQRTLMMMALAAGTSASAGAQTLYGVVDLGFVAERGGVNGAVNKISSGAGSVSRFGLRGSEDLGGGLSAIYTLEAGVKADTGELDNTSNMLFQRQAFAGLSSTTYGTLTLGRQYTPFYTTFANFADPFATSFAGTARNLFPVSGATTRANNTVKYASPEVHGWSGEAAYSFGEQAGSERAGRQMGFAIAYRDGPLNVRLGYLNRNSDVAPTATTAGVNHPIGTNTILAANYDFQVIKLFAAYEVDHGYNVGTLPNTSNPYGGVAPTPSTDARELLAGFTMPVWHGTLIASHIHKDDRTRYDQDARQNAIAYVYPLSKRSNLYTAYARISNRNGAGYTVGNNGEVGTGDGAFNLGVRHTF